MHSRKPGRLLVKGFITLFLLMLPLNIIFSNASENHLQPPFHPHLLWIPQITPLNFTFPTYSCIRNFNFNRHALVNYRSAISSRKPKSCSQTFSFCVFLDQILPHHSQHCCRTISPCSVPLFPSPVDSSDLDLFLPLSTYCFVSYTNFSINSLLAQELLFLGQKVD